MFNWIQIIALVVVIIALDWTIGRWLLGKLTHQGYSSHFEDGGRPHSGLALLYYPGTLYEGRRSVAEIKEPLVNYSDKTMFVSYGYWRFFADAIVERTAAEIGRKSEKFDSLIIFGASMGGKLAAELILLLKSRYGWVPKTDIALIAGDTPPDYHAFKQPGRTLSHMLSKTYAGPLTSLVFALVEPFLIVLPMRKNIDPRLNVWKIKWIAFKRMMHFWMSSAADQQRYLFSEWTEWLYMLDDVRLVYIECTGDNITVQQPETAWRMRDRLKDRTREYEIVQVPTTHCGFLEQPYVWSEALDEIIHRLADEFAAARH